MGETVLDVVVEPAGYNVVHLLVFYTVSIFSVKKSLFIRTSSAVLFSSLERVLSRKAR
jgi:hypothetical protein